MGLKGFQARSAAPKGDTRNAATRANLQGDQNLLLHFACSACLQWPAEMGPGTAMRMKQVRLLSQEAHEKTQPLCPRVAAHLSWGSSALLAASSSSVYSIISAIFCSMDRGSMMKSGTLNKLVTSMPMYFLIALGLKTAFLACAEQTSL